MDFPRVTRNEHNPSIFARKSFEIGKLFRPDSLHRADYPKDPVMERRTGKIGRKQFINIFIHINMKRFR
jgi:hypothetical protein